jgi:hypothetical protein
VQSGQTADTLQQTSQQHRRYVECNQITSLTLLHTGHIPFCFSMFVHFYTPFAFSQISLPHQLTRLYFPLNFAVFPCPFLHTNIHSDSFTHSDACSRCHLNLLCTRNSFLSVPLIPITHGTCKLSIQSLIPSFPNPCCFTSH